MAIDKTIQLPSTATALHLLLALFKDPTIQIESSSDAVIPLSLCFDLVLIPASHPNSFSLQEKKFQVKTPSASISVKYTKNPCPGHLNLVPSFTSGFPDRRNSSLCLNTLQHS